MPQIAHAGHWIAGMLYLLPVLILVAAILWQRFRDRDDASDLASDERRLEEERRPRAG